MIPFLGCLKGTSPIFVFIPVMPVRRSPHFRAMHQMQSNIEHFFYFLPHSCLADNDFGPHQGDFVSEF